MASRSLRVVLTGGGSGGHIYPLLAVAEALATIGIERSLVMELSYMGPTDVFSGVMQKNGITTIPIISGKLRRYSSLQNILDIPRFLFSIPQALWKLFFIMPDVIFSKGGSGALPVVVAGWFYRIPIIIHESDAIPGLTNLLSRYLASRIAVSFEGSLGFFPLSKTVCIGNPLREDILKPHGSVAQAKEALGFDAAEPLVLVLGGSQGAVRINEFILTHLAEILPEAQVLHQTGYGNFAEVEKLSRAALADISVQLEAKHRYKAVAYIEEMGTALTAADVVVSRAGSNSIFEIAATGRPSILIPLLESANDHQKVNAYEFAKTGAAAVIEENNLLGGIFIEQLKEILNSSTRKEAMAQAAKTFFRPNAAQTIAREIVRLLGK